MKQFLSSTEKEFSAQTSKASLELMSLHNVHPIPENYQLWYTHAAQSDLNLSRTLERVISKNIPFNDAMNRQLHDKFFSQEKQSNAIKETGATFQTEMAKIINIIKDVGQNTNTHTDALSQHIESLSDFDGSDELKDVIQLILNDTNTIKEQSSKLESKLMESTGKISALQENLENARLESRTDALTNIGNRKYFDEQLQEHIDRLKMEGEEFCLILSDIDFFKKFNDTYGHQIGDQVLKVVAHVIKNGTGEVAFPARYGGEEFAILVPKSNLDGASILSELVRKTISTKSIKNKSTGENFGKITMSFGIAQARTSEPAEDIIARADAALYLAKENGRNRVQDENDLLQTGTAKLKASA